MKIDRNRARKGAVVARRFSVSPVTRAVRSVLTVSAAALAFSGTGLALASAPVHTTQAPAFAGQHADLSQHAAFAPSVPVVDLTVVGDSEYPASVVAGDLGLHAALNDSDLQFAGPVGPGNGDAFDRVFDVANVQSFAAPGPGGGSGGSDDQVFFNFVNGSDFPGAWFVSPHYNSISVTSNTGLADGWFISVNSIDQLVADWTMDVTGATWAAGVEMEAATHGYVRQTGDITATATYASGQAIGVYVSAGTDARISNDGGSVTANATGAYGIAVGLFGYADSGVADVGNNGLLTATANNAGTAVGVSSTSVDGTAFGANNGTMSVSGGDFATGVAATSFYGSYARAMNNGTMTVSGGYSAIGLDANADYGNAQASNGAYGSIQVDSLDQAIGMQSMASGNAAVNNMGDVTATATALRGYAFGQVAIGGSASGNNAAGATMTVSGSFIGIGMDVEGDTNASATNLGQLDVYGGFAAMGMYAGANGNASVSNGGTLNVDSVGGNAFGILAYAGNFATAYNGGPLTVSSVNGDAIGVQAISAAGDAYANNTGPLKVSGDDAKGLYATSYGTGDAHAENSGTINAGGVSSAYGMYAASATGDASIHNSSFVGASADGMTMGAYASGANASIKNDGDIIATSASFISEGIFALGATTDVSNSGTVGSYGILAVGLDSEGVLGADVTNSGSVIANGFVRAYGLLGVSQNGDVTINNSGSVDVDAAGVAYGAFASGAGAVTVINGGVGIDARSDQTDALGVLAMGTTVKVTNAGGIVADGASAGVGIYAGGDVVTIDSNSGDITATARNGAGFAAGILAVGNDIDVTVVSGLVEARGTYATGIDLRSQGLADVVNDGTVHAYGSLATGISVYGAGEGNVVTATNGGDIKVGGTSQAVGIQAVSRDFKGGAIVTNTGSVILDSPYAAVAQGLVAAGDQLARITNSDILTVDGGSRAYGALALSADVEASFTNSGIVDVEAHSRGGIAFGALVQGNTGIASVVNDNSITAVGATAYGAYATGLFSHASVDNHGHLSATANAGNAFGALAYSYNNIATITNDGDVEAYAAVGAVGLESLSLFGAADVTNDGTIYAGGNARARGAIARSLFGAATTSNSDTITVRANGGAYGMWSRGDFGTSDASNTGIIDAQSYGADAFGILSGGYYGATLTNAAGAKVDARGYFSATAAQAYANYGDATVTNDGSLRAFALGNAYGIVAQANFDATVTNTGTINASSIFTIGDGIYAAAGGKVTVTSHGDIIASGGYWSAGIEGRGDDVEILSTAGIDAYVYDGRAFGSFGQGDTSALVRNNGPMNVTAEHGVAYGEFAAGGFSAETTNGGVITVNAHDGVGIGTYAMGANVDATNSGTIVANGTVAAIGMGGNSDQFHSKLINHGDITAFASGTDAFAAGLSSYGVGYALGINNDTITAHANDGTAMGMYVYGDTAVVKNSVDGNVRAYVGQGTAIGSYSWGTIANTVTNDGAISASNGYGDATGIMALGDGNVQVNASQTSTVGANGNGPGTFTVGILANGDVAGVDNAGTINVGGNGALTAGIQVLGDTSATIGNTGHVYAGAGKYSNTSVIGMLGSAYGEVTVDNAGLIAVHGGYGATGIVAASLDGAVNVTNAGGGTINATDGFTRFATGIDASSTHGDVAIDNAGTINAGGTMSIPGPKYTYGATTDFAIGATAYSEYGSASIVNSGTINAIADVYGAGLVAESFYGAANVQNTGTVHVTVDGEFAIGLGAHSALGNASVTNDHDVTVLNTYGAAIGAAASGDRASATNTSNISVTGVNGAVGMGANGALQADVVNGGTVTVVQTGAASQYGPVATGLFAHASAGNASVSNTGTLSVSAYDDAIGIDASAYGDTTVTNTHDLTVAGNHGYAMGVMARNEGGAYGNLTSVINSGAIHAASGNSWAEGVFAAGENVAFTNTSNGHIDAVGIDWAAGIDVQGDNVSATNAGAISANATGTGYTYAVGISGYAYIGLTIANSGHVEATSANGVAKGVSAYGDGSLGVDNAGTIDASATSHAIGIDAEANGGGGVSILNGNSVTATSGNDFADGVFASGHVVSIVNHGNITATAPAWAAGMEVDGGSVTIVNGGDIAATSTGNGQASGIYAYGNLALSITNTHDVTASAQDGGAFGISARSDHATTSVLNDGQLLATSAHGSATGVSADGGFTTVSNAGTVNAHAFNAAFGIAASGYASASVTGNGTVNVTANQYALGIGADADVASVDVGGTLVATADRAAGIRASGDTGASVDTTGSVSVNGVQYAIGVQVSADTSYFHNANVVSATASGDDAIAAGGMVFGTNAGLINDGSLTAAGTGEGGQAIGAFLMGGDISLGNYAAISATSTHGAAVGALVGAKYGDGTVTNGGTITATGNTGSTVGLVASSFGDLSIANSGTITAIDATYATALGLYADGIAVVTNTGNIVANSNLEGSVAIAGGAGIEDIRNAGMLSGALVLSDGDDVLTNQNHGTWIVRGHGTDFGGGDDHIVNAAGGTIVMNDSAISLGSHASAGNSFTNAGLIAVDGDDNSIDLGTGLGAQPLTQSNIHAIAAAPATVLNPIAFTNNGTISFLDGVTDDVLTIHGDFAGQGALNVDISLLNQASDMLYVEGNVSDGTKQALNVRLLDLPNTVAGINIPVVAVTGDSKVGEFVAGTFSIDRVILNANNFVNVKVGVTERINTANATADLFSLTVAMDGVNDTGSLAGDIATGAQSLMTTQVGTFRQRMGVFSRMGDSDTGAWVRVFHDKGTITPDFVLDNMPQNGRFGFEQTNSGVEAGINAYVTDGFFVGATLGKSEGKQSLDNGFGSDKLKGDTAGLYMTYLSPNGFYADVSYRWMHFDAELTSAGGRQDSGGDVGAFNVEAGWNVWTSASGLKLVPQAQYTRSEVSNVDLLHGDLADFAIDGGTSSRGRVGLELEQTFKSASGATWTPYGTLSVVREFDGEHGFSIADTFTGHTSTEGTSGMLEVGANVKMGNLDIFGGLNWTDGGAFDSILGGQVGLRYTW